ncbi:MAG: hypothetical protein RLZZ480_584 [Candidatus Parcubacteria bacterium]|jgi:hypothetical protein
MTPERITDESVLSGAILKSLPTITEAVKKEVGTLETDYIRYRRRQRFGVLLIAFGFFLPNLVIFAMEILAAGITSWWSNAINILVFLASVLLFGYFGLQMMMSGARNIRRFHGSVDHVLFAQTFTLLGVEGKLVEHSAALDEREFPDTKLGSLKKKFAMFAREHQLSNEANDAIALLKQSELITEPFNHSVVDNLFSATINGQHLQGAELDIKHITGYGKNRQTKHIFKGYFISYELPHTLDGRTFISTEGDETGFGHRTFWSTVAGTGAVETKLEWNEFEALLHVATTDRIEARYILTPRFMAELYDWWKGKETNIRMSFIGNRFYMIFPDSQTRIDETVDKINEEEVRQYMLTIARPLMHVVRLVENIRMS